MGGGVVWGGFLFGFFFLMGFFLVWWGGGGGCWGWGFDFFLETARKICGKLYVPRVLKNRAPLCILGESYLSKKILSSERIKETWQREGGELRKEKSEDILLLQGGRRIISTQMEKSRLQ